MSVYTTITSYTSACHEIFNPTMFYNLFPDKADDLHEAEAREQFAQECFDKYTAHINEALKPYNAHILGNGEVVGKAQGGTSLDRETFREIIQAVDMNTTYNDVLEKYFS